MNEEDNIVECLSSLEFCDEVILVDSHSTDRTREIAESMGAKVIERDWPGFGKQKEFAALQASHDWVLCLDADEWVSDELRKEILALLDSNMGGREAWRMPRLSNYFGTWVRRGGWYPDFQLRLYDRRRGHWGGRPPHEHVEFDGTPGKLSSPLMHKALPECRRSPQQDRRLHLHDGARNVCRRENARACLTSSSVRRTGSSASTC